MELRRQRNRRAIWCKLDREGIGPGVDQVVILQPALCTFFEDELTRIATFFMTIEHGVLTPGACGDDANFVARPHLGVAAGERVYRFVVDEDLDGTRQIAVRSHAPEQIAFIGLELPQDMLD